MILKKVILTIILYQSFVFASLLDNWLKTHKAEEFKGKVWIRARIDEPEDLKYIIKVWCNLNPPGLSHKDLGFITKKGLQNTEPKEEESWFKAGEESLWVELPTPVAPTGYVKLLVKILEQKEKNIKIPELIELYIQIATGPDTKDIFYETEILDNGKAGVNILLPTKGGLDGLKEVKTFDELFSEHIKIIEEKFGKNHPTLEMLPYRTWLHLDFGTLPPSRAENVYRLLKAMGMNGYIGNIPVDNEMKKKLDEKYKMNKNYAIIRPYQNPPYIHPIPNELGKGEKLEDYIENILEDHFKRWKYQIDENYIQADVGDEIGPGIGVSQINENNIIFNHFIDYLEAQGLEPEFFGVLNWKNLKPTTKREMAYSSKIEDRRTFFWTYKYINHYTALIYSKLTNLIQKYYPSIKFISPNFQAGPFRIAFLGNDNEMRWPEWTAFLDLFKLGREKVFTGIQIEDWTVGWDCGLGYNDLGSAIMRACARKHNLSTIPLIVYGDPIISKCLISLMNGCKGINLYLYGPIGQIGPAWALSEKSVLEAAELARLLTKFEKEIYNSKVPTAPVAFLISSTSDIMQAKDLYFLTERQHVYLALRHSYIPVDIISEQDIIEDNVLQNYKVLYIVDPNIPLEVQKKILQWVSEGGFLWAEVGAGMFDEYNSRCEILNEVFGVKKYEMKMQKEWLSWAAAPYSWPPWKFKYEELSKIKLLEDFFKNISSPIVVRGIKMEVIPNNAEVVGIYEDGNPAILINNYKKGKAMLIGALMGEAYIHAHYPPQKSLEDMKLEGGENERRLISYLVKEAGVKQPLIISEPSLYANISEGEGYKIIWLVHGLHPWKELKLEIKVKAEKNIKEVISAKLGKLNFGKEDNYIKFTTLLSPGIFSSGDIILIKY
jgi:hypothetical protein